MMTVDTRAIGAALPGYDIGEELGQGAFGVVVAAQHVGLHRLVAIKQLDRHLVAQAGVRSRFRTEARVLASFQHPHVVPVYDYVESGDMCLLVMERLDGGSLAERYSGQPLDAASACATVVAVCSALDHTHGKGVLHRDIKPQNLLFASNGVLKVTDFGIARVVGGAGSHATAQGNIIGTPAYMAPEQASGDQLGPPVDIYATGVLLYELLSGRLPFSTDGGALMVAYRHVHENPVDLRAVASDLPDQLAEATMRSLARSPQDRFATAEEFGVAVATAATAAFGVGWLTRSAIPLLSPGPILDAANGAAPGPAAPVDAGRTIIVQSFDGPPPRVRPDDGMVGHVQPDLGMAGQRTQAPRLPLENENILRTEPPLPPAYPNDTAVLPVPSRRRRAKIRRGAVAGAATVVIVIGTWAVITRTQGPRRHGPPLAASSTTVATSTSATTTGATTRPSVPTPSTPGQLQALLLPANALGNDAIMLTIRPSDHINAVLTCQILASTKGELAEAAQTLGSGAPGNLIIDQYVASFEPGAAQAFMVSMTSTLNQCGATSANINAPHPIQAAPTADQALEITDSSQDAIWERKGNIVTLVVVAFPSAAAFDVAAGPRIAALAVKQIT